MSGSAGKLLLQHDIVLPAIAEIVGIDHLRARSSKDGGETGRTLAFSARHSHEWIGRFWPAEAPLMAIRACARLPIPSRFAARCAAPPSEIGGDLETAPDGRFGAEQCDLDLIDVRCRVGSRGYHVSSFSMIGYGARRCGRC